MLSSRTKLKIDRSVGQPLALVFNVVARFLGILLKRNHSDAPQDVQTIVVSKFLGYGSIIQASPFLRALKTKYPTAKLYVLSTRKNLGIVERIQGIDGWLYIRDSSLGVVAKDTLLVLPRLWALKIDLYFDLEVYSSYSTILQSMSMARNRYGLYRKSALFRRGLNTHMVFFNPQQHISDVYMQFAAACGILEADLSLARLMIEEEDTREAQTILSAASITDGEAFIVVNINASDLMSERQWPRDSFRVLLEEMCHQYRSPILLVGGKSEREYVQGLMASLSANARDRVRNIAGETSLAGLVAIIHRCKLLITCDSGPAHIAQSIGTRCLILFGPVSPSQYGPKSHRSITIWKSIYCSPCLYHSDIPPCGGDNQCMKLISPREVMDNVMKLLDENNTTPLASQSSDNQLQSLSPFGVVRGRTA